MVPLFKTCSFCIFECKKMITEHQARVAISHFRSIELLLAEARKQMVADNWA